MFAECQEAELPPKGRLVEDKGSVWAPKLSTWVKRGIEMGRWARRELDEWVSKWEIKGFLPRQKDSIHVGTLAIEKPFSTGIASYKEEANPELVQACTKGETAWARKERDWEKEGWRVRERGTDRQTDIVLKILFDHLLPDLPKSLYPRLIHHMNQKTLFLNLFNRLQMIVLINTMTGVVDITLVFLLKIQQKRKGRETCFLVGSTATYILW